MTRIKKAIGVTSGFLIRGALVMAWACSAAHLDPNSRALTLSAPAPEPSIGAGGAAAPKTRPKAEPTRGATTEPRAHADTRTDTEPSAKRTSETDPKPPVCSNLPDPVASRTDQWVVLAVRMEKGVLQITSSSQQRTRRMEATKRSMGRFAAELWIGCELIDRVRFDFPLLAAEPTMGKAYDPSFERAGRFETSVVVPDSDRATRIELVDRANENRRRLDWPLRLPEIAGESSRRTVP